MRNYRLLNREHIREQTKTYRREHPERVKKWNQAYWERKAVVGKAKPETEVNED